MINIDILQVYITNVCNLTCGGCESFNDRAFKGHFYWNHHEEEYRQWSKILHIENLGIIGGEPFTNPDLLVWVKEFRALWPNSPTAEVWTNGTHIKSKLDLSSQIIDEGFQLRVSVHDPAQYDEIKFYLEKALPANFKRIELEKGSFEYFHKDKRVAKIYTNYNFYRTAQKKIINNVTYMHKSDPDKAFAICGDECHYFHRGKLYRCALTAIASDLTEQFEIENEAAALLKNYKSCSPWDPIEDIQAFVDNLSKSVPQCSVCPENRTMYPIWPLAKSKTKF